MAKRRMLSLIIAAFALTGLAGCDRATQDQLTGVTPPASDLLVWTWSGGTPITTSTPAVANTVVATIGPNGGRLVNGPHVLTVPKGAVTGQTEFTFKVLAGHYIHTDFSARRVKDGVAVTTFPVSLQLKLSYAGASVTNPSDLGVMYLVDGRVDGEQQPLQIIVNAYLKTITVFLPHFSQFILLERD